MTGFYPYPFVNITNLGFTTVAINGAGVVLLLLAVGALDLLVDNLIARRQKITYAAAPMAR